MAVTFSAADRVGVVGGYIGGIGQILQFLGGGMAPANANTNNGNGRCNGNCNENCSENTMVNRFELQQEQIISRLQSERDMLLADQRNDGKMLEVYKYFDGKMEATNRELANIAANQAVINQRVTDNLAFLDSKIDCTKKDIMCYVNGTFVPGKLVMPLDAICPAAQPATATTTTTTPAAAA